MCCGDNSASQSVQYINSQLSAHWENASNCVNGCKGVEYSFWQSESSRYTQAFAQFHFSGKKPLSDIDSTDDLLFHGIFSRPTLHFICNHEAMLSLWIQKGHLYHDTSKAIGLDYCITGDDKHSLEGVHVVFRLPFSRSKLTIHEPEIGRKKSKGLVHIITLNLDEAKLALPGAGLSARSEIKEALDFYMHEYLSFLQHSGRNIFFDVLALFDKQRHNVIDYALYRISEASIDLEETFSDVHVGGVEVGKINRFLNDRWMDSVSVTDPKDHLSVCLSEIRSTLLNSCGVNTHFRIRFGTPLVKTLCSHEVVIYFDITDIAFYQTNSEEPICYKGWQIAFVVNFIEEKEGSTTCLRLVVETARYAECFSTHDGRDSTTDAYYKSIVKYLENEYLKILLQYSMHIIYETTAGAHGFSSTIVSHRRPGSSTESTVLDHADEELGHRATVSSSNHTKEIDLHGFDHVQSTTEESINSLFEVSRTHHKSLRIWSHNFFSGSFDTLTIRLLTSGKAIVWVNISEALIAVHKQPKLEGFLRRIGGILFKSLLEEPTRINIHTLHNIRLAFEVDLVMIDSAHLDVAPEWFESLKSSYVWPRHEGMKSVTSKHLFLDFRNPRHIPSLSTLSTRGGSYPPNSFNIILGETKIYLRQLAHEGHNILLSLPIFTSPPAAPLGFTTVTHKVLTKTDTTAQTCRYESGSSEAPIILILGMCNFQPLPSATIAWSSGWVITPDEHNAQGGSVSLSHGIFLEGRLLHLLSSVNRETTIVPKHAGKIDGQWQFDLTTWHLHEYRRGKECLWKRSEQTHPTHIEYTWEHRDEWIHEHEGTYGAESNGEHKLSCHTHNKLCIPTVQDPSKLEIVLKGKSTVGVSGRSSHQKWSKKTIASWSASILVHTYEGIHIEALGDIKPIFSEIYSEGECPIDTEELHAKLLPQFLDLTAVLKELKSVFEEVLPVYLPRGQSYTPASPFFTRNGDLVVQLRKSHTSNEKLLTEHRHTESALAGTHESGYLPSSPSMASTLLKTPVLEPRKCSEPLKSDGVSALREPTSTF